MWGRGTGAGKISAGRGADIFFPGPKLPPSLEEILIKPS